LKKLIDILYNIEQNKLQTNNVGKWIDIQLKEMLNNVGKREEILETLLVKIQSFESNDEIK